MAGQEPLKLNEIREQFLADHGQINRFEFERRSAGLLYDCLAVNDPSWIQARDTLRLANAAPLEEAQNLYRTLIGSCPKSASIIPPFYCDLGRWIVLGEHTILNMDCLILDEAPVVFGNHVLVGPRCSFYTASHPIDPQIRATGLETCAPIYIEDDVWIGGSCTIVGGVTIHAGSVIGAGSVVIDDIPAGVIAAGNPCRVIREISEEEKEICRSQYGQYLDAREKSADRD